jgi:hypothetical protein
MKREAYNVAAATADDREDSFNEIRFRLFHILIILELYCEIPIMNKL